MEISHYWCQAYAINLEERRPIDMGQENGNVVNPTAQQNHIANQSTQRFIVHLYLSHFCAMTPASDRILLKTQHDNIRS